LEAPRILNLFRWVRIEQAPVNGGLLCNPGFPTCVVKGSTTLLVLLSHYMGLLKLKLQIQLPYDLAVSRVCTYAKGMKQYLKEIFTHQSS
jgi:hypothetical protein